MLGRAAGGHQKCRRLVDRLKKKSYFNDLNYRFKSVSARLQLRGAAFPFIKA